MPDEKPADLLSDGFARGRVEFGDDDPGVLVGEAPGDALADARARAGDQRDLAGERPAHRATPATPVGQQLSWLGAAVEGAGGAHDDLPSPVGSVQPEMIGARPRGHEAVVAPDQQNRLAHRDRVIAVDGDDCRAEEMATAPADQALMGVRAHHRRHVVAAAHQPPSTS